ncbi:conserved protein of unknown function [Rhodovastum atsumiense]|uniref:Uncharacterized protein n=1 Tax=Rhodovastum atsumiense TaxID=504468 RepID=A0A5M6J0B3_9PROT|nr:hypothetical protein [Rhodovastum atsumiense]KAA5613649.1 hypothetical protein F1189_04340 [Rhodovastum atsumiense]CAH2599556.1 conserved protein of unknown function [Rhodovastum atsumiense]
MPQQHHKFTVGQEVSFLPSASDFNVPRGTYRIVRQLPLESSGYAYRVKNVNDGHERIIAESQLAAGSGLWVPTPPPRPAAPAKSRR